METFFAADLHLDHANIIKHSKRPFKDMEEMNETLIDNWNRVVGAKDVIYVLGDFAFTGRDAEEHLKRLKGRIRMLRGNHDNWLTNKNCFRYVDWVQDYHELKVNKQLYVLSHYPIHSWNKRHYGSVHLYGHTHKDINIEYTDDFRPEYTGDFAPWDKYMCVSMECINYTPISLSEVNRRFNIVY